MDWLSSNWIWIAFGAAFVALHMFGHGYGRGHSGHIHGRDRRAPDPARDPLPVAPLQSQDSTVQFPSAPHEHGGAAPNVDGRRHRHGC